MHWCSCTSRYHHLPRRGTCAPLDNFLCPLAEGCLSKRSVKFALKGLNCLTHPGMRVSMERLYDFIHEAVRYPYPSITTNFTFYRYS